MSKRLQKITVHGTWFMIQYTVAIGSYWLVHGPGCSDHDRGASENSFLPPARVPIKSKFYIGVYRIYK